MVDPPADRDGDSSTREEAQNLWSDSRHWALGIIYSCREDPRVIVRNRFVVGWTWNFAHPRVFPTMGAFVLHRKGQFTRVTLLMRPGHSAVLATHAIGGSSELSTTSSMCSTTTVAGDAPPSSSARHRERTHRIQG